MRVYYDAMGAILCTMNGDPNTMPAGDYIEVPEETDTGSHRVVNGALVHTPPDPAEVLAQEREAMRCEPLQGILALGEAMWSQVEAMAADPETPFPMRISILRTVEWIRNSQMMDELAWIMDLTDEQVDDLFRIAMTIVI